METIEKHISNLVENQFPSVYREYGPVFVLFVRKYYEWLETTNQHVYYTRRFFEYKDIDETTEQFLIYFKEKYLKNIQLETIPHTRLLIKHSLDLYRSKGTERSIELLFRIAFGADPKIYYPRKDLFKLSDGVWHKPKYLEVTLNEHNIEYASKQIKGIKSNAIAFVDSVVRKTIDGTIKDLFYISSINSNFLAGEKIVTIADPIVKTYTPTILGSLNSIEMDVAGSGSGFIVGDVVNIHSSFGRDAKARVATISDAEGVIDINLNNGGYGYTVNSEVLISEKMITINETVSNLHLFETFYQPLANLNYLNATGSFVNNDLITTYYANGSIKGTGKILTTNESNTTAGELFIEILSGNCNANTIYTSGNLVAANLSILDGYTDKTATGNIMFLDTNKVYLHNVSNTFSPNAYWYSTDSLQNGLVLTVSVGSGLSANISNDLLYSEYVMIANDLISPLLSTSLVGTFGFSALPSANLSTIIGNALSFANTEIGKISSLININPGDDYNFQPIIRIIEPTTYAFHKKDYVLHISNASVSFQEGEIITQSATNGRALITFANSTIIEAENLRFSPNNEIIPTSNSTTTIIGDKSAGEATIDFVFASNSNNYVGFNANVDIQLISANGVVTSLDVLDSGFNFKDGETITFSMEESNGSAIAVIGGVGFGNGYYKQKGGFVSDSKKLFDGYYWQDYSYEIKSPLTLNKYKDILKNVVHTAGFKMFGSTQFQTKISTNVNYSKSKVVIT